MSAPKKRYGQHFLEDLASIERIVRAVAPAPADRIVEIGPGEGALTLPLLAAAGQLTAIELDAELIAPLRARAASAGRLSVVQGDVLAVDFAALAGELGVRSVRVVGNLPYYISSPILFHCMEQLASIRDMHFMLQKEVVLRMAARPGSRTYGRLSVMLQLACTVEPLFEVPARAFRPPPKVDSAVVRLTPRPAEERSAMPRAGLERLVKAAFAQRRKTLANALRQVADDAAIRAAGIDPRVRAEDVEPEAYVRLARLLAARAGAGGAQA